MERHMVRIQVYLTEEQERGLKQLAATSGRKQSQLIRDAIESYLTDSRSRDWRKALESIHGMWADRDDLDNLHAEVGRDWEQRLKRLYRE
jgi:predicted DNA-binding protein